MVLVAIGGGAEAGDGLSTPVVGPFTRTDYPQAVIDRPLTLPAGMVEGELGATFQSTSTVNPIPRFGAAVESGRTDDWLLDITLRGGLSDRVQVEVGTAFSLDHVTRGINQFSSFADADSVDLGLSLSSWQRVVPLRLSLLALDTDDLDTALTLTLPFVAYTERQIPLPRQPSLRLRNGTGRVIPEVDLAAPTRWRLTAFWRRCWRRPPELTGR